MGRVLPDLRISKMTLGTVQFGMPYGLANKTGMPDFEQCQDIIAVAYENGITTLDTASSYGASEQVIGKALANLNLKENVTVVTKVPGTRQDMSAQQAARSFEQALIRSIRLLKIDPLPLVLLHNETDIRFLEQLVRLKQKGMLKHAGISVQYTKWAEEALKAPDIEAIQWPASMLDTRFEREGLYKKAAGACAVFLRSIYLQGLLVMQDADTPQHLKRIVSIRAKLREIAESAGIGIQEMALRYALGLRGCTSVVVGMESVEQVKSNVKALSKGPLDADMTRAIRNAVPELGEDILLPVNWTKQEE